MKESSSKSQLFKSFRGKCAYCGTKLSVASMTIDHVFPKCKGGIRSRRNTKPACSFCNSVKADLNIKEFRLKLKELAALDNERGQKVRNKYDFPNGKVEFFYEKLRKTITQERQCRREAWERLTNTEVTL